MVDSFPTLSPENRKKEDSFPVALDRPEVTEYIYSFIPHSPHWSASFPRTGTRLTCAVTGWMDGQMEEELQQLS